MSDVQIFIYVNNKTICVYVNLNSKSSTIYDIIQSKLNYDISRTHNLYFSGQNMDPNKQLNEYKIIPDSQIKVMYSIGKDLSSRPRDLDGIFAYKKLIKQFERKTSPNDFYIFSLMSYNVCDIDDYNFTAGTIFAQTQSAVRYGSSSRINEGSINKNLYQQLQPDAIVQILNDKNNKDLDSINLNIILSDSGFISFNEQLVNSYNNYRIEYQKQSVQIDRIFGLIPSPSYLKTYLNVKTNKLQNKYANRVIKFYCSDSSKADIMKYFELEDVNIIKKINFTFYYVGIHYPSFDIKLLINSTRVYGINYSNIFRNLYVNMWTGEFLLKNKSHSNDKQKPNAHANAHTINYLSYNNPNIKII